MTKENKGGSFDLIEHVPGSGHLILFRAPSELKTFGESHDLLLATPYTFVSSGRPQFGVGLHIQKPEKEGMGGYTGEFDEDLYEFLPSWRAMMLISKLSFLDLSSPSAALKFIKGLYGIDYQPEERFINFYELTGELTPDIDILFEALGGEIRAEAVFRELLVSEPSEEEMKQAQELASKYGVVFPPQSNT